MKTLVNREGLIFSPPQLSFVLYLPGLPGGDSKIYDRSPCGNHGTITGATWIQLPSGVWCLSFDGQDDFVDCGVATVLNFTSEDFTVKLWVCRDISGDAGLITRGQYKVDGWMLATQHQNKLDFRTFQSNEQQIQLGSTVLSNDTWHHVVVSRSGSSATLYLNGRDDTGTPVSLTDPTGNTNRTLRLASQTGGPSSPNWPLAGDVALIAIYNRAWTALDVQNNFNQEKHLFGVW